MEIFTVNIISLSLKQPRAEPLQHRLSRIVFAWEYAQETSKIQVKNCFLFSLFKLDELLNKDDYVVTCECDF